MLETLGIK